MIRMIMMMMMKMMMVEMMKMMVVEMMNVLHKSVERGNLWIIIIS